ncbi:Arsenic efflux pump protein [Methanosarcina sp. WWM596]|nr:Arsenic efflux pump protein [Methanosarcina sp. WWM596]AKB23219.1 Arsenic efflux pump protein [Methanosarcina sp. WH1]
MRPHIWQVMTLGAFSVLLLGKIPPQEVFRAINLDVLLFLFGAFCVGETLNRSGYFAWLGSRIVSRATDCACCWKYNCRNFLLLGAANNVIIL